MKLKNKNSNDILCARISRLRRHLGYPASWQFWVLRERKFSSVFGTRSSKSRKSSKFIVYERKSNAKYIISRLSRVMWVYYLWPVTTTEAKIPKLAESRTSVEKRFVQDSLPANTQYFMRKICHFAGEFDSRAKKVSSQFHPQISPRPNVTVFNVARFQFHCASSATVAHSGTTDSRGKNIHRLSVT